MSHDLAVIGAGPAGLAAAVSAAEAGLDVALIDMGTRPGGQYYRHHLAESGELHHGWAAFTRLRDRLHQVTYLPEHRVWQVAGDQATGFTVHALAGDRVDRPVEVRARTLLIAAGAYDRSLPFPGWDLPGVMTAGGAQALLKGGRVAAGTRVVVAGTGPFLLPVATGLVHVGASVAGVFEAARPYGFARHLTPGKAVEGAGYAAALARHRVPYRLGHAVIAAHGDEAVEAVTVARLDRNGHPVAERRVECDTVAVGYGFTPQLELPLQLGCATRVDADGSLIVAVDAAQRTSVPGVYAAGETTGVGGAQLSLIEGELAALAVAFGAAASGRHVRALVRRRAGLRAFAAAMHRAYPVPRGWDDRLRDDTIICRCEEVPYARIREALDLGATDPRAVKLLTRAGMGWCQGRVCGFATTCLTPLTPPPPAAAPAPTPSNEPSRGPDAEPGDKPGLDRDAESAAEPGSGRDAESDVGSGFGRDAGPGQGAESGGRPGPSGLESSSGAGAGGVVGERLRAVGSRPLAQPVRLGDLAEPG